MNEFLENVKKQFKDLWLQIRRVFAQVVAKVTGKPVKQVQDSASVVTSTVSSTYEINLVPAVKAQMIKAQKVRNLVLFICIVVSSVAVGVVVILFGIKSGQDIAISNQGKRMELMSNKINEFSEMKDLVTIQDQLGKISDILDKKTVLSRVFGALSVMLPEGEDEVKMSELRVDLQTNTLTLEGQADARKDPLIDYRVLESFKKGVALTKYDYGRYVDATGNEIPTQCVSEADAEGNAYKVGDNFFAWWDVTIPGCEAVPLGTLDDTGAEYYYTREAETETGTEEYTGAMETRCDENGENCQEVPAPEIVCDDNGENCVEVPVELKEVVLKVKIWRTPQFNPWYGSKKMDLEGKITGIEHFNSACISYRGTDTRGTVRWTSVHDETCMLAPGGLEVLSSSNGRNESDNLVLKFSARTEFSEAFFGFQNKHMIAIGPLGQNVTDSYVQIGNMFAQEARECDPDDKECNTNRVNEGGY